MKINNIVDDNYNYRIIEETTFNNKYLLCNSDGSKYKRYLLMCYKEENNIKYDEVLDESYLDRFANIIKIYKVEEIISTCVNFDNMYNKLKYFHVDNLYFIKFLMNEEFYNMFESNDDYKKIKEHFTSKLL